MERIESWQDESYVVRPVAGANTTKPYRCPGCDQEIPAGTPHLVAWPEDGDSNERRHWHTACWRARDRRAAKARRRA